MAEKKSQAQRRQEANRIHSDVTFRMMGKDMVAEVSAADLKGDQVGAKRIARSFKNKGWTAVITSKGGVIATVEVSR